MWTEADFDDRYLSNAESRYGVRGRAPIYLHYHDYTVGTALRNRAGRLIEACALSGPTLVLGCGFGWTCEAIEAQGIPCIGVDTSDYIQSSKDISEEDELRACIEAAGVNPDTDLILCGPNDNGARQVNGDWMAPPLDIFLTRNGSRTSATILSGEIAKKRTWTLANQANQISHVITESLLDAVENPVEMCESIIKHFNGPVFHVLSNETDWKLWAVENQINHTIIYIQEL